MQILYEMIRYVQHHKHDSQNLPSRYLANIQWCNLAGIVHKYGQNTFSVLAGFRMQTKTFVAKQASRVVRISGNVFSTLVSISVAFFPFSACMLFLKQSLLCGPQRTSQFHYWFFFLCRPRVTRNGSVECLSDGDCLHCRNTLKLTELNVMLSMVLL